MANQHKGVADPARLTSPLGAELLQRKVARQQRASGEAVDGASGSVFEGIDEGDGPNADPNQCSSLYSTELLHRKVANQHKGVADPARLTSPLGAELLQRKVARQQRQRRGGR